MLTLLFKLPKRTLIVLVRTYQLLLSPWLGGACRFEPRCSAYALQALEQHGAAAGTYLAIYRVLRCQPLCCGGRDAVPEHAPPLFRRFARRPETACATAQPSLSKPEPNP